MQHCCDMMTFFIDSGEIYVEYCPIDRSYAIPYKKSLGSVQRLEFCPWCSKKLPAELRDELFDILESEYGLDITFLELKEKAPQESHSDEWWVKRGL